MKITFIGGGNMASALIGGLRKQGFSAAAMQVVEPEATTRERLTETFGVRAAASLDAAALHCEVLVLAVKPQVMKEAIAPAAGRLANQLVISIAAGLRLGDISRWLGGYSRLIRCMPNTPALIGAGITGLYADPAIGQEDRACAEQILRAVGQTVWITDEALMDVVTAISGSGPAYFFYFIETLAAAGKTLGLPEDTARQLAVETALGAARLAQASAEPLATLRERVTSKGGTTEAALEVFTREGFDAIILRAVSAAAARGRELSERLGKD